MLAPLTLGTSGRDDAGESERTAARDVELFDVFTDASGAKIPSDQKSLAYFKLLIAARAHADADEVNAAHAKLKVRLKTEFWEWRCGIECPLPAGCN